MLQANHLRKNNNKDEIRDHLIKKETIIGNREGGKEDVAKIDDQEVDEIISFNNYGGTT